MSDFDYDQVKDMGYDPNRKRYIGNDRDNGTQDKSSGSGCYLTTACMCCMKKNFDDSYNELMTLRWFRDNYVSEDDIKHYYNVAPIIVDEINLLPNNKEIYTFIYKKVM